MNHKWGKEYKGKHYKDERIIWQKCKVCGCERGNKQHGQYQYVRSGILFGYGNRPDCIDWEEENSKTID